MYLKRYSMQNYCCCSAAKSCPTLCDPMDCSTQDFPVLHHLPEFAKTHVHWVGDAIQPSHPLMPPFPSALNLSQHEGLFQRVGSLHQVAKILELQQQSFQWIFRVDFLQDWLVWYPCSPCDSQESPQTPILWCSALFMIWLSHPYLTTGKTIALTIWTFVGTVMSLIFDMPSRFDIVFLPRSKCLFILRL